MGALSKEHSVEEIDCNNKDIRRFSVSGLARALNKWRQDRRDGWRQDYLSFQPLHDRPSPLSLSASADGPIGTIVRIEINARNGLPHEDGLPPDPLNEPGAP